MNQQSHSGVYPKKIQRRISKRYMHTNIHCIINHNSQEVETTQMFITDEWIKKMYIHTMEYYRRKSCYML